LTFLNYYNKNGSFLNVKINEKEQKKQEKRGNRETRVLKNLDVFIEETRNKFNFVSKLQNDLLEKKKIARAHYVGYDPEEDD